MRLTLREVCSKKSRKSYYLDSSASGEREFVVVRKATFADEGTGTRSAKIGVYNAVKGLGELEVYFHGARGAAQTRRCPKGNLNKLISASISPISADV